MTHQAKKMSEMMKEMSERLLRHPDAAHSSEAAHVEPQKEPQKGVRNEWHCRT